jgi:hypothetical protein
MLTKNPPRSPSWVLAENLLGLGTKKCTKSHEKSAVSCFFHFIQKKIDEPYSFQLEVSLS